MTADSHQNLWFPGGFLERMACCALPPNKVDDLIILGDSSGASDDIVGDSDDYDGDEMILQSSALRPFSQVSSLLHQPLVSTSRLSRASLILNQNHQLRSPTLSPSRRELDPWDPSCLIVPTACHAGSTATTASIGSEEDDYDHYEERLEEIRSNATTQVVSHRKRGNRRHKLLSSTLASAEHRLKLQFQEQELRERALKGHRRQRD